MINQIERNGETVLPLNRTTSLVASKSQPGTWWIVKNGKTCECKGFEYRGHCRHVSAVAPAVLMCESCGAIENVVNRQYYIGGHGYKWFSECEDWEQCEVNKAARENKRQAMTA